MLLSSLQERNERLFFQTVIEHVERILPLIYTPTVGEACREFSHIARDPKGFFITPDDRGKIRRILGNWPRKNIRVIVVTDGQRILGLGDLGANGMGIPIGKLALYTACAGIDPASCLPVTLDVGTNNETLLADPLYLGYPHKRLEGKAYFDLVEEFVSGRAVALPRCADPVRGFPDAERLHAPEQVPASRAVLQRRHPGHGRCRARRRVFIDPHHRPRFKDLKIMFLGAGSAATGIADLMTAAFQDEGLSLDEARRHLWFVDVHGLVVKGRKDLMEHNLPYAHDGGASGFPRGDRRDSTARADRCDRRARDVHAGSRRADEREQRQATDLCALEPNVEGRVHRRAGLRLEQWAGDLRQRQSIRTRDLRGERPSGPAQGNNAYVFPGIGLGAVACRARTLPDEVFLTAARTLADLVQQKDLDQGSLYPPLSDIRKISLAIATGVATKAYAMKLARQRRPANVRRHVEASMYWP